MRHALPLFVIGILLSTGCQPAPPPAPPALALRKPEPMRQVVEKINAGNNLIPHLWARHYYEVNLIDDQKQSHLVNGDGVLLYRRPRGMLLVGTKPLAGRVFEIGSNDENYWLKVIPDLDTMWWGKYEHLGKPCVQKVPIAPNLVFEVLGISTFGADLTDLPAPVMRFNSDADAYMFVWIDKRADRYVPVKEVWYDRSSLRPTLVLLFDDEGQVVLRAYLGKHQPVEIEELPPEQWPKVATTYKLYFPESGTTMSFELSDMVLDKNGIPSRRGIVFPGLDDAGVAKVIQLDEPCEGIANPSVRR